MTFKKIGSLIKLSPKYRKSEDSLSAMRVRQISRDVLFSLCRDYPEELVKKIKVTTYKNGVLTIVCPSVAAAELHMRSHELLDGVNSKVGVKILKDVKFRVG